jgi:hypothetical protein
MAIGKQILVAASRKHRQCSRFLRCRLVQCNFVARRGSLQFTHKRFFQ